MIPFWKFNNSNYLGISYSMIVLELCALRTVPYIISLHWAIHHPQSRTPDLEKQNRGVLATEEELRKARATAKDTLAISPHL